MLSCKVFVGLPRKNPGAPLDFMKWLTRRNEKPDVNWPSILKEL